MTSIRALHEAADAAMVRYIDAEKTPSTAELSVLDEAYTATSEGRNEPTKELTDACWWYLDNPTAEHYTTLIAAALACHATDTEAT